MKLQGVIFDLDGTLVDSEPNWYLSDKAFVGHFGGVFDEQWRDQCVGMGSRAFVAMVCEKFGLKQSQTELEALKDRLYLDVARGKTTVYPEMLKLVKGFSAQGMPMAIASGSSFPVIEAIVEETGLRPLFQHLISSDEAQRPKPAPDVFLLAAKRLGLEPHEVLVLEDSQYGVEAAKAAGMRVCAIPSAWPEGGRASLRKADLLFDKGFAEFQAETVLDWIDRTFCQCDDCTLYEMGVCRD
ncbi:MAG: HAD family phosphatase [Spirochaetales bacterium]